MNVNLNIDWTGYKEDGKNPNTCGLDFHREAVAILFSETLYLLAKELKHSPRMLSKYTQLLREVQLDDVIGDLAMNMIDDLDSGDMNWLKE